jgi:hypothetical protein
LDVPRPDKTLEWLLDLGVDRSWECRNGTTRDLRSQLSDGL